MSEEMNNYIALSLIAIIVLVSIVDIVILVHSYVFSSGPYDALLYWVYSFLPANTFSIIAAGILFLFYSYRCPNVLREGVMRGVTIMWYGVLAKFMLQLSFTTVERIML